MIQIGCIVEGHGDRLALPTLITAAMSHCAPATPYSLSGAPFMLDRARFEERFDDFENALAFLSMRCSHVVVVLDSDDDDPAALAEGLERRSQARVPALTSVVAPAVREYEAWVLAGAPELAAAGLLLTGDLPEDVESRRGCKEAVQKLMPSGTYSPTADQKRLTAALDLGAAASRSPSLAQFLDRLAAAIASAGDESSSERDGASQQ